MQPASYQTLSIIFIYSVLTTYLALLGLMHPASTPLALGALTLGLVLWIRKLSPSLGPETQHYLTLGLLVIAFLACYALIFEQIDQLFEHRYGHFKSLLALPLLAILLAYLKPSPQHIWRLFALAGLFALYYSVLLIIKDPVRASGGEGLLVHPIIRGNLGMLFGVISLIAFLALKGAFWKAIAAISFISGITLSVLTESRGGWPALVIAFVTLAWFTRQSHPYLLKSLLSALILMLGLVFLFWDHLPIGSRLLEIQSDIHRYLAGDSRSSLGYRFEMWQVSWEMFKQHPLLGAGLDSFRHYWETALQAGEVQGRNGKFGHPHNDFILMLSQIGLLGFGVMMLWLLYPLKVFWQHIQKHQNEPDTLMMSLTGLVILETMLIFMLSNHALFTKYLFEIYLFSILAVLTALNFQEKKDKH